MCPAPRPLLPPQYLPGGHVPSRETGRQAGSHLLLTSSLPGKNLRREGRSSGSPPALRKARGTGAILHTFCKKLARNICLRIP